MGPVRLITNLTPQLKGLLLVVPSYVSVKRGSGPVNLTEPFEMGVKPLLGHLLTPGRTRDGSACGVSQGVGLCFRRP